MIHNSMDLAYYFGREECEIIDEFRDECRDTINDLAVTTHLVSLIGSSGITIL